MILNNCTTCGRKPEIKVIGLCNYSECKCGKQVSASKGIWTAEVAADMWNRANPAEDKTMRSDYINYIAACLAKAGIKIIIHDYGFSFETKRGVAEKNASLMNEALEHGEELTEFYRKRLEPAITT